MQADFTLIRKALSMDLMEILIRFSLIAFLVIISVKIFSPLLALMLWAVILAVTLYPLHQRVAKRPGGIQGVAATVVDAPMPIILLGTLGGMVSAGLTGLFVGAVFLALGYVVFMDRVDDGEAEDGDPADENIKPTAVVSE